MFPPSVCVALVLVTLFQSTPPNCGAHQNIRGRTPPNEVAVVSGQQQPIYLGLTTRRHGWCSFFPQRELANTVQKYQIENDMAPPLLNRKRPDQELPAKNCGFDLPAAVSLPQFFSPQSIRPYFVIRSSSTERLLHLNSRRPSRQTSQLASVPSGQQTCWIACNFPQKSKIALGLIKDVIMRYEEGEQIGLKFKNAWRNQEYETK